MLSALNALRKSLKIKDFESIKALAGALDDDGGGLTVARVHEILYPEKKTGTANRAFERLSKELAEKAAEARLSLRIDVRGAKSLGGDRSVAFTGEIPISATPDMREIADAEKKSGGALINQNAVPLDPAIVLLTVNTNEAQAVLDAFVGKESLPASYRAGETLYDELGRFGGRRILHISCEMGQLGAAFRTKDIIRDLQPVAVISVGVAFGANEEKQAYGDVIVATQVLGYERQRVNKDRPDTLRDSRLDAPSDWLQVMRRADNLGRRLEDGWPMVRFGPLLSGEKLVDNAKFRDKLLRQTGGEAIGGEMETLAMARACQEARTHWLAVKAIADWGDGNKSKGEEKTRIQYDAAFRAAWVVRCALAGEGPKPLPATVPDAKSATKTAKGWSPDTADLDKVEYLLDNVARRTSLDAHSLLSPAEPVRANQRDSKPALESLLQWVADPKGTRYFAVLGEYGMGKTIVCQRLMREMEARRKGGEPALVPLYFDLKKVTGLRETTVDATGAHSHRDRVPVLDEILRECVERGWNTEPGVPKPAPADLHQAVAQGALVIFDGLDEVLVHLSEGGGLQFTDTILRILPPPEEGKAPSPSRVLVSCRTHFFRSLRDQRANLMERGRSDRSGENFGALVLLPFSEEQIETYLRHAFPDVDIERTLAIIRSTHNLPELLTRPYLLGQIGRIVPRLEQMRAAHGTIQGVTLYREIVRDWLDRDKAKSHIRPEHKLLLAEDLAAALWRRGQRLFPAQELESWFHAWRRAQSDPRMRYETIDLERLEEDLRNSHFLVREDGETEESSGFRFAHTSLAEFFLASYLVRGIRENRPESWAMPVPSKETLDFLGQMIAESDTQVLLRNLGSWRSAYRRGTSELLLAFAFDACRRGRPVPVLRDIDLQGANLAGWSLSANVERSRPALDLSGANLARANLRGAVFEGLRLERARFESAILDRAEFLDCRLGRASFTSAGLAGSVFRKCLGDGIVWEGARLHRTSVLRSNMNDVPPGAWIAPADGAMVAEREVSLRSGHAGPVYVCAFSADGKTILSASDDKTLRLWDAHSAEPLAVLEGHTDAVVACAFSADGKTILSASYDKTLRLWDAHSAEPLAVLKVHTGPVVACAFSADGKTILSASYDKTLRLWDAHSAEPLAVLEGHTGVVFACAFSADGKTILSASDDKTLRLWDAHSAEPLAVLEGHTDSVRACAFSADGKTILSASDDKTLRLWDAHSAEPLAVLEGHTLPVLACAFSADGKTILSASDDNSLRLWDAHSGELRAVIEEDNGPVYACAFSADGKTILSASLDDRLRLWDAHSAELLAVLEGDAGWVLACAFPADGNTILSAGADNTLRLWDAHSAEPLAVLEGHTGSVRACAFSADGKTILSASDDKTLRLWDAHSAEPLAVLEGHTGGVRACAFSADGKTILSASSDTTLRLWDAHSAEPLAVLEGHTGRVVACAFSADGTTILSASWDKTLRLWDAHSAEPLAVLEGHTFRVDACAFSADGNTILSASFDATLRLWDAHSAEPLAVLEGHRGPVYACAFSADGKTILSASDDNTLRLWDAHSAGPLAVLKGHTRPVVACAFSADGKTILSASEDNTVRLWDAHSLQCTRILLVNEHGSAAWEPRTKRIIRMRGEVWRDLRWRVPLPGGRFELLPIETFGDLVEDSILAPER